MHYGYNLFSSLKHNYTFTCKLAPKRGVLKPTLYYCKKYMHQSSLDHGKNIILIFGAIYAQQPQKQPKLQRRKNEKYLWSNSFKSIPKGYKTGRTARQQFKGYSRQRAGLWPISENLVLFKQHLVPHLKLKLKIY